jgi:hypothetical protein
MRPSIREWVTSERGNASIARQWEPGGESLNGNANPNPNCVAVVAAVRNMGVDGGLEVKGAGRRFVCGEKTGETPCI